MMEFWPFTNFHDLNLDWIIKTILDWVKKMQNFVTQMTSDWNDMKDDWQEFIDSTYKEQITEILEDHPEWVTTVMDGAITEPKLNTSLSNMIVKIFKTVSDMTASTNLRAGDVVKTCGYYTEHDGGGSFYIVVNQQPANRWSESLANNLYAVLLMDDNTIINVKKHGIHADGVTDDSVILQAIIDFYASQGTKKWFYFTDTTLLENSVDFSSIGNDINIKGSGIAESMIKLGTGATILMKRNAATYNIRVNDLNITGAGDAPLLDIDHYANIYFTRVSLSDGAQTGFVKADHAGLLYFNDCNLDGYGQLYQGNTKPVFIDYYSAYIAIIACNVYHLDAVINVHMQYIVMLQNNWVEDCDKIVEYHNNNTNTSYASSVLSMSENSFLKTGGVFYLLYSASASNNLTNQVVETLGNRYFMTNTTNTYLSYIIASMITVNLADTDYHANELFDPAQVLNGAIFYRTFRYRDSTSGPTAVGNVLGTRKICLSATMSQTLNTLYADSNKLWYQDGDGTLHQINMS